MGCGRQAGSIGVPVKNLRIKIKGGNKHPSRTPLEKKYDQLIEAGERQLIKAANMLFGGDLYLTNLGYIGRGNYLFLPTDEIVLELDENIPPILSYLEKSEDGFKFSVHNKGIPDSIIKSENGFMLESMADRAQA